MRPLINMLRRNIVAYVALLVALSGTAVAAVAVPRNSVGNAQLKNGAVTNAKVRKHSLTASVFTSGVLKENPAPASGTPLETTVAVSPLHETSCTGNACPMEPAGMSSTEVASCPTGDKALSGGYTLFPTVAADETVSSSTPTSDDDGWEVTFVLTAPAESASGVVSAVCAAG
jgi:hypothetical protein